MHLRIWYWLVGLVLMTGCETVDRGLRERFSPARPVLHTFAAESDAVFEATGELLPAMGFKVTRSRSRAGIIEGVSRVQVAGDMRGARQTTVKVVVTPTQSGETEMQVWMTEVIQDNYDKGPSMGTSTPLRDSMLHEALFSGIARELDLPEND